MVASRSDALDTLRLAVSGAASRLPERVAVRNRATEGTTDAGTSRDSGFELPIAVATGQPILSPAEERREASPGGEEGPTHSCPAALAGGDPNRREFG
jgi:hypothetical protein